LSQKAPLRLSRKTGLGDVLGSGGGLAEPSACRRGHVAGSSTRSNGGAPRRGRLLFWFVVLGPGGSVSRCPGQRLIRRSYGPALRRRGVRPLMRKRIRFPGALSRGMGEVFWLVARMHSIAGGHNSRTRAAGSVFSKRQYRAACQRAPRLSNIPTRSAHHCAHYHSHEAPSLAAPLTQPQGWRVDAPTRPPSLQPQNRTAGRGSGGGITAQALFRYASPSALCELSPAEKAVKYFPPSMGNP